MKKLNTLIIFICLATFLWAQDHVVLTVGNTGFNPTNLTINVGETVEWQNTGGSHNVNGTQATYPNNPESFGNSVGTGWTFQHTFNTPGSYEYRCDPHVSLGMVGTVTVMESGPQQCTIGDLTADADGDGFADSLGVVCEVTGVVYGVDLRGGAGLSFTIIGSDGEGINVFSFGDVSGYSVQEGDEITLSGEVIQFNGLTEISPDEITLNSAGNALMAPTVVTSLSEDTESQLIQLQGMTLVDPGQWTNSGSGFNVDITDGTNTFVMRIDNDVDLYNEPAPTGTLNITGIGGQFDTSEPYTEGYQILPRYMSDIQEATNIIDPALGQQVRLFPNPVNDVLHIQSDVALNRIRVINLLGQEMVVVRQPGQSASLSVADWPLGIYLVTYTSGESLWTSSLVKE